MHTLSRDESNLFAIREAGEGTLRSLSYMVPVKTDGTLFDEYCCEFMQIKEGDPDVVYLLERMNQGLLLKVEGFAIWFKIKDNELLKYAGKLSHPDFEYQMIEIDVLNPYKLDELFEQTKLVIVGCNPFSNYKE